MPETTGLREAGPRERWRPADKPNGCHGSNRSVQPDLDGQPPYHAWGRDRHGRRRHQQKTGGAEVALRHNLSVGRVCPERCVRRVDVCRVAGRLRLCAPLCLPMLNKVYSRPNHPTRGERHEQKCGQNGVTALHGIAADCQKTLCLLTGTCRGSTSKNDHTCTFIQTIRYGITVPPNRHSRRRCLH